MLLRLEEYRITKPSEPRRFSFRIPLYNPQWRAIRNRPQGLTLVEMLIGMAITLVMMAAVVTLFANLGAGIRVQKAAMDISGQLRTTRARLYKDLAGATCDGIPKSTPGDDDKADGYIEIVEGQWSDKNPTGLTGTLNYATSLVPGSQSVAPGNVTDAMALGDYDDILALTVRSDSEPFVGRWYNPTTMQTETVESNLAEVIWYAVENPADGSLGEPGMRTVYRRVLLIAPWVQGDLQMAAGGNLPTDLLTFYRDNDISVRRDSTGNLWIPNDLSDLVKRENRFGHFLDSAGTIGFPFAIDQRSIRENTYDAASPPLNSFGPLRPFGPPFSAISEDRQGEDVMLNDVLAFDVRVYDPGAPLLDVSGTVVEPSELGWNAPTPPLNLSPVGFGSYVDLFWNAIDTWTPGTERVWTLSVNDPPLLFNGVPNPKSGLDFSTAPIASVTYDTWSFHYENDGIDQDNGTGPTWRDVVDQGTNGLDDDGFNGTDPSDVGERETSPPYNVPLRGIQVKIRVYEPDTRQIREATVTRSFVP